VVRWVVCGAAVFALVCTGHFGAPAAPAPPKPDPRAWPATYQAADITLDEVLLRERRETGVPVGGRSTFRIAYAIKAEGLEGSESDTWRDSDYHFVSTLGPVRTESGRRNGRQWEQDENGYTRLFRGYHHRVEADEFAVEAGDPSTVRLAGRIAGPCDCYVVAVGPQKAPRERRFYDATTARLIRIETQGLGRLAVVTYDDFRATNGVTYPWRTAVSDGRPANDVIFTVTAFEAGGRVTDDDLAMPAAHSPLSFPAGTDRVRLPVRIDHGRIIVRVDINGRGLDFQLDSGADEILIDRDVAARLNLPTVGHRASETAGPYTSSTVVIGHASIGALSLDNVVATAAPFHFEHDFNTEIVGLLGYDLIAGCVLRVDYPGGHVDALRSSTFRVPPGAVVLDTALDDAVPAVTMVVNGVVGQHFIVDTGADDVMIFPGFADAHPEAVKDDSKYQLISRSYNVVVSEGVGGDIFLHLLQLHDVLFGNVHFRDQVVPVLYHGQQSFEGEDLDGLVGVPFLYAFIVSFDYDNERVVLEPGPQVKFLPTPAPGP